MGKDNGKGEEPGGRLGELCCLKKQSLRHNFGRKWKGTPRVEKQKMEREKEREESLRKEEQF